MAFRMSQGVFIPDLGCLLIAPQHWQASRGSVRFAHSSLSACGPLLVLIWAYERASFSLLSLANVSTRVAFKPIAGHGLNLSFQPSACSQIMATEQGWWTHQEDHAALLSG